MVFLSSKPGYVFKSFLKKGKGLSLSVFRIFTVISLYFQSLMTTDSSPVIDFYPAKFDTDLNGKQQDWEAVVLIPFIDEVQKLIL